MECIKNIKAICDEVERVFPAQIVIDFFEEFESEFLSGERNLDENPIQRDQIGAIQYGISTLLEVMDHDKFKVEVDILNRMNIELGVWYKEIEARNILLGIPREQG